MNDTDFSILNKHLDEIRPIVDRFSSDYGFAYVDQAYIGKFPRVRIERTTNDVTVWFDLWMEYNQRGRRYERFQPDLPYELSGGAYSDIAGRDGRRVRFMKTLLVFAGKPFAQVGEVLLRELEAALVVLERWDLVYLRNNGKQVMIRK